MLIGQDSKKSVENHKNCGKHAFHSWYYDAGYLQQVDYGSTCALAKFGLVIIWTWGQSLPHRVGRKIQFSLTKEKIILWKWTGKS